MVKGVNRRRKDKSQENRIHIANETQRKVEEWNEKNSIRLAVFYLPDPFPFIHYFSLFLAQEVEKEARNRRKRWNDYERKEGLWSNEKSFNDYKKPQTKDRIVFLPAPYRWLFYPPARSYQRLETIMTGMRFQVLTFFYYTAAVRLTVLR